MSKRGVKWAHRKLGAAKGVVSGVADAVNQTSLQAAALKKRLVETGSVTVPKGVPVDVLNAVLGGSATEIGTYDHGLTGVMPQKGRAIVHNDDVRKTPTVTLADRFLTTPVSSVLISHKEDNRIKALLHYKAKRVVLDRKGCEYLGKVMREIPDHIALQQQFARQPYPTLWVEFSSRDVYIAVTGKQPDDNADCLVGYLYHEYTVYVVVSGYSVQGKRKTEDVSLVPMTYNLHRPWKLNEQTHFADLMNVTRLQLVSWVWGTALSFWLDKNDDTRKVWSPSDETRLELAKTLRDSHTAEWFTTVDKNPSQKTLYPFYEGSSGELRTIITILLLMNQPNMVQYVRDVPTNKRFSRGKLRTYMSHSIISIHADPVPSIVRMGVDHQGSPHRRHEVRGHYCHNEEWRNGSHRGCEHVTEQKGENSWTCKLCGGKRWWRKDHQRGDASLGFVQQDYELTK
jgi:hypothetical protein